jgi:hypothetical protein
MGKTRRGSYSIVAALGPAIPTVAHCAILIEITATSPTMTLRTETHFKVMELCNVQGAVAVNRPLDPMCEFRR